MKTTPCTPTARLNNAPRCLAKTRQGTLCQSPAVRGKRRCRMHGCGKGSGAPIGNMYALTHGHTTMEIRTFRRQIASAIKASFKLTI